MSVEKETKELVNVSIEKEQIEEIDNNQVKANQSQTRRQFSNEYKLNIVEAYDACDNSLARGKLLRKEGFYYSQISLWRQQRDNGKLGLKKQSKANKKLQEVNRENAALKRKLAQTEAVISLQKKVSELLGQHILEPESSE